jgi:hypothetical protein
MKHPYPKVLMEMDHLSNDVDCRHLLRTGDSPYAMSLVSFSACCRNDGSSIGRLRLARLAVACQLHKALTGKLPEKLGELAAYFPKDFAEVSTDPFSGNQMLYKRSETGFVVYSVGPYDSKDDGAPDPYDRTWDPDLTFPVDLKLWEDYRAKQLQRLKNRGPSKLRPKNPPPAPSPKPAAPAVP